MPGYWTVPNLWRGDTAVILGGGPSLKAVDLSLLRGKRVIAVNCAYKLGQFDACFFGDGAFVERNAPDLKDWTGIKVTRCADYLPTPWIHVVRQATEYREGSPWRYDVNGISTDPTKICWNRSSGACAINLAVLLGAGKIILTGFDMHTVADKHNWHDYYPDNDLQAHVDDYRRFTGPFGAIARDLAALAVPCINATPGSALTEFPILTPEEALSC